MDPSLIIGRAQFKVYSVGESGGGEDANVPPSTFLLNFLSPPPPAVGNFGLVSLMGS